MNGIVLLFSSKDAGLPMTVQIYGATVTALSRSARQAEAKHLVSEAEKAGIPPDIRMLTDLIDPRCGPSTVDETCRLLQKAKEIAGSDKVDSQLLCAAAASLNEAEGWSECLEVSYTHYNMKQEWGFHVLIECLSHIIDYVAKTMCLGASGDEREGDGTRWRYLESRRNCL